MAKSTEKYAYLDRLTTEQLELLLRADIESPEPSDDGVIFHILEVIEQREKADPTKSPFDVNDAWNEFQQYYNISEGNEESLYAEENVSDEQNLSAASELIPFERRTKPVHLRSLLKRGFVAAIIVVTILGGMVVAQASGIDVFGAIGRWTEETFLFVTGGENKSPDCSKYVFSDPMHEEYYNTIQTVLTKCEINAKLAPRWYPDGYEAIPPEVFTDSSGITASTLFIDEQKFFHISITRYYTNAGLDGFALEKENTSVNQYTSNQKTFYIVSNLDTISAAWADVEGLTTICISGTLTIDEIKSIINSIGG